MKYCRKTPLLTVPDGYLENGNTLYIKEEYRQPSGSAKARCAEKMIFDYIKKNGDLRGKTVIESTSGNTGLALAYFGSVLGYHTVLVTDDECPVAKINRLREAGAEVIVLPCRETEDARQVRIGYVSRMSRENGYIWLNQYANNAASLGHIETAREIVEAVPVDYCFAAVGTGATLRGIIDGMKKYKPSVVCVGVEPRGSVALQVSQAKGHFLSYGPGYHEPAPYLAGIKVCGRQVTDDDAVCETALLNATGAEVGISTGLCVRAVKDFIAQNGVCGKRFVVIGADKKDAYADFFENRGIV